MWISQPQVGGSPAILTPDLWIRCETTQRWFNFAVLRTNTCHDAYIVAGAADDAEWGISVGTAQLGSGPRPSVGRSPLSIETPESMLNDPKVQVVLFLSLLPCCSWSR